ncbi:MAG: Spi family protease inhibitor, partial [Muribaculaceae bacterium]|nr:Spi family protease inhibitor [Muribaculaceae bacterium]
MYKYIKPLVIISISLLTYATAGARQLTPNEALARATGDEALSTSVTVKLKTISQMPRLVYTAEADGCPGVYVMTAAGVDGFIAVSADDVAVPVL